VSNPTVRFHGTNMGENQEWLKGGSPHDAMYFQWEDERVSADVLCLTGTTLMQWSHDRGVPEKRIRMVD